MLQSRFVAVWSCGLMGRTKKRAVIASESDRRLARLHSDDSNDAHRPNLDCPKLRRSMPTDARQRARKPGPSRAIGTPDRGV